jgi:starvation-inducible DNA-binding protein
VQDLVRPAECGALRQFDASQQNVVNNARCHHVRDDRCAKEVVPPGVVALPEEQKIRTNEHRDDAEHVGLDRKKAEEMHNVCARVFDPDRGPVIEAHEQLTDDRGRNCSRDADTKNGKHNSHIGQTNVSDQFPTEAPTRNEVHFGFVVYASKNTARYRQTRNKTSVSARTIANMTTSHTSTLPADGGSKTTRRQGAEKGFTANKALSDNLQTVLVDLIELHIQFKQAHWNLVGPNFRDLHLQLDEIIDAARLASDTIAERMRALHAIPDGRSDTVAATTRLPEFPNGEVETSDAVDLITSRLDTAVATMRGVHDAVDEADPTSADILHATIASLEQYSWMVSAENRHARKG